MIQSEYVLNDIGKLGLKTKVYNVRADILGTGQKHGRRMSEYLIISTPRMVCLQEKGISCRIPSFFMMDRRKVMEKAWGECVDLSGKMDQFNICKAGVRQRSRKVEN